MKTIDALTLTPKQQRFCDEYLIDMNATRAALRAGYSQNTALNGQLMEVPKIQAYLKERRAEASQKLQIDHETLLGELMKVAFANMGDYFGADGKVKNMNEVSDAAKAALWNVKVSEKDGETTLTIRMHNKMAALGKLVNILSKTPAPQPEVQYVSVDKNNLDAFDKFDDASFDEPEVEEEQDEDEDDEAAESEEDREQREKEIRLKAVRETEERLLHDHEREINALKQQMAETEEKWLKKEARAFGIPSKAYIAHIMNNR